MSTEEETMNSFLSLPIDNTKIWQAVTNTLKNFEVKQVKDIDGLIRELSQGRFKCEWFQEAESGFPRFPWKEFVEKALPGARKIALEMPELFPEKIPLLLNNDSTSKNKSKKTELKLNRKQCACLLIHSLFGTMIDIDQGRHGHFNSFFCVGLFMGATNQKAMCLLNYVRHVGLESPSTNEMVTFERVSVEKSPEWSSMSDVPLCKVNVLNGKESITDSAAPFHVDFANMFIGGGSLSGGCVQEEILFLEKPELIVAQAIMEVMTPNEAIALRGAERHSILTGYGREQYATGVRWAGDASDKHPSTILAIDAIVASQVDQFEPSWINREILKAYAGFLPASGSSIATGNWGCGAFGGDLQLKFIEQWIAASVARVDIMNYHSFGDRRMGGPPLQMIEAMKARYPTVSALYSAIIAQHANLSQNNTFQTLLH